MDYKEDLLDFAKRSSSPFHTVKNAANLLKEAGFKELKLDEAKSLKAGARFFINVFDSSLFAFTVGKKKRGLKIAAAHTDFPGFRVKHDAYLARDGYGMLNVEPYGGIVSHTWIDRPLSLAGKVVVRGKTAFSPKTLFVDFARPLLTIPGIAVHLDKSVNEGLKLNKQTQLMPLLSKAESDEKNDFFLELLAKETGAKAEDILSYDLTVYAFERGTLFGAQNEFLSAPRLDNLTSVKACIDAIASAKGSGINLVALFDNEEVGSHTKQGAASSILAQVTEYIYRSLGLDDNEFRADVRDGFLLSCDAAHALHPNYGDKADATNRPHLNGGVVLKRSASQSYAGDAEAVATIEALCRDGKIAHQYYANRSDIAGGSTLGSIASAALSMRAMDVGVPLLSMHSASETMGADDQKALTDLCAKFFTD